MGLIATNPLNSSHGGKDPALVGRAKSLGSVYLTQSSRTDSLTPEEEPTIQHPKTCHQSKLASFKQFALELSFGYLIISFKRVNKFICAPADRHKGDLKASISI